MLFSTFCFLYLALCLEKLITNEAEGGLSTEGGGGGVKERERELPVCLRSCSGDKHRTLAPGWMSLRGNMN